MRLLGLAVAALLLLYPLAVYFGGRWLEPRVLGAIVLSIYLLRLLFVLPNRWQRAGLLAAACAGLFILWQLNSETLLRLFPAAINLAMAGYFSFTLWHPPTLPARMAALSYGRQLPEVVKNYTSRVTQIWIGFFIVNASLATFTALFCTRAIWTLYNGLLAYIFIALLFACEYAYRELVFHKKHGL